MARAFSPGDWRPLACSADNLRIFPWSGVRRNTPERVAFHEEAKDDFSVPGTLSVQVGHPVAELLVAGDPIGKWCLHVGLEDPLGFALGRIGNPDRDRARRLVLNPHPILKLIMARLGPGGGGAPPVARPAGTRKRKPAVRMNARLMLDLPESPGFYAKVAGPHIQGNGRDLRTCQLFPRDGN